MTRFQNFVLDSGFNDKLIKDAEDPSDRVYVSDIVELYHTRLHLILDVNGELIKEGEPFTFDYNIGNDKTVNLIGCFVWNESELCYKIDILDNDYYTCLYYNSYMMYDFTLLEK